MASAWVALAVTGLGLVSSESSGAVGSGLSKGYRDGLAVALMVQAAMIDAVAMLSPSSRGPRASRSTSHW